MARKPLKARMTLEDARAVLADTEAQIAALAQGRQEQLLAGADDIEIDTIDAELETLKKTAARHTDRIRVLEAQAAQQEAEAVKKRRRELTVRFEKKLADADKAADELQGLMAQADRVFRKVIALREEARAGWPLADAHHNAVALTAEGCALSGHAVRVLLNYEIYRIGARPFLGGRPGETKGQDFPGGVCPDLRLSLQPEKIPPFAEALRRTSAYAVDAMRNKLDLLAAALPVTSADAEPITPTEAAPIVAPATDAIPASPPRTPAQDRLSALLKKQNELAMDDTPAGDAAYQAVVREIAALS
jgi:hypothetical protein